MIEQYHSEDITFCTQKECGKKSCFRHMANIRDFSRDHTVADLKGTVYCQLRPEPVRQKKRRGKK